ncbi:helix-turn-helix domain-containing protein [Hugenholtzia roseola]|uniref:helix-turn-helix domain-containing protein n=1 Tax=Hugenholtzia roseola TaxID=1002 RepID=UPI0012B5A863|nr:helix-turn-helix transcriptional regulator [Hugenholtzia roseola]
MIQSIFLIYLLSMNTEQILAKLRQIRKEKGVSQEDIAEQIGVSRPTYLAMENGKQEFSLQRLEKVVKFLNIDIYDLIDKKDEKLNQIAKAISEIKAKIEEIEKKIS